MKPVFNSLVLFFAFCPIYSLADVVKYDSVWGQNCHPSEESYAVKMKNVGDKPVDFKVCLEKKGGGWSCFVSNYVQPGAIEPKSWCYRDWETDRKSTRLNSSHSAKSRMPSSA